MDLNRYADHQGEVTAKQLEDMILVDESKPFALPEQIPLFLISRANRNFNAIKQFVNHESNILDIGCRTGIYLFLLKQSGFKNLFGIEIHPASVSHAQKRELNVVCGDMHALPYGDKFFDAISCTQVIEHTHDPQKALEEIHRVLKQNGVLWVDIPLEGPQAYNEEFNHAGHHSFWGHPAEFAAVLSEYFSVLNHQIYLYPPDVNGKVWAQGAGFLCKKEGNND